MSEPQRVNLVAEAAMIVVSILLAFAIEAWWSDWQQADDEAIVLQSLLDDLYAKQEFLEATKIYYQNILSATIKLIETSPASELKPHELDATIDAALWSALAEAASSSPLESLFSGASVIHVTNQELLQQLASLNAAFKSFSATSKQDIDFFNGELMPFMRRHSSLAQLTNGSAGMPHPTVEFPQPTFALTTNRDHSSLLESLEFQNLLINRVWNLLNILNGGYGQVEAHLGPAIRNLEVELGR